MMSIEAYHTIYPRSHTNVWLKRNDLDIDQHLIMTSQNITYDIYPEELSI